MRHDETFKTFVGVLVDPVEISMDDCLVTQCLSSAFHLPKGGVGLG